MSKIGLHLRLEQNISEVIEKALRLDLPFFQNFLITQTDYKYVKVSPEEKRNFLKLRREHFGDLFVHGSYWINGACASKNQKRLLKKELTLARELEYTHYILHPGSARGLKQREDGINNLAGVLNEIIPQFPEVKIILENTAHGKMTVGSDFDDFYALLEKLNRPESIDFCIDTAHAHVFGYDLACNKQQPFLDKIEKLGKERVAMIHLNDACEKMGSKIDRHEKLGSGMIGDAALEAFVKNKLFDKIPIALELPEIDEQEEIQMIQKVKRWCVR